MGFGRNWESKPNGGLLQSSLDRATVALAPHAVEAAPRDALVSLMVDLRHFAASYDIDIEPCRREADELYAVEV